MNRTSFIAIATVLAAGPAFAADPIIYSPPLQSPVFDQPVAATNWTGFNVGIFGGAAFNRATPGVLELDQDLDGSFTEPLTGQLEAAFDSYPEDEENLDFFFGANAGFDVDTGTGIVVGGIVDIAKMDYQERQGITLNTPATYTQLSDLEYLATARVRAGFLVTDSVLAYAHGGVAVGNVNHSFETDDPTVVVTESGGNGDDWTIGYQVGAGVEMRVAQNVSVGLEYAYTNLGETDYGVNLNTAAAGPFNEVNAGGTDARGSDNTLDFHAVKGAVKFHF